MPTVYQPAPTWALPVIVDEFTGDNIFNPVWISWFLGLSSKVSADGTPTSIGDAAITGDITGSGTEIISGMVFGSNSEVVIAIGNTGGGTQDFDLSLGNVFTATVTTSANTFTFSNPSATGYACSLTIILTNGGSQTVNWPASVDWNDGSAPVLTAAGVDILEFLTVDGGTIWHGFTASRNSS